VFSWRKRQGKLPYVKKSPKVKAVASLLETGTRALPHYLFRIFVNASITNPLGFLLPCSQFWKLIKGIPRNLAAPD